MDSWTYTITGPEYFDTEMDKEFLLDLRELRPLIEKDKEHKQSVITALQPKMSKKCIADLDVNFRTYSRSLLVLATSLHRARDLRNLYIDLSQILDVWKHNGYSASDLEQFLCAYTNTTKNFDLLRDPDMQSSWVRYMGVVTKCMLIMF